MLQGNLTRWGRVTHICVSKLSILGSDNCLSPGWRQAIIWTNAGILLIWPLGTNFSEIFIEINTFSFKKMHLKMSSGKWRPFCLGLNVLIKQNCALRTPYAWKNTEKTYNWEGKIYVLFFLTGIFGKPAIDQECARVYKTINTQGITLYVFLNMELLGAFNIEHC